MESIKDYNQFYRVAYEFHAKWHPYPSDTMHWEKCLDDMLKLSALNKDHPFLQDILMTIVNEMQRTYQSQLLLQQRMEGKAMQNGGRSCQTYKIGIT